MTNETPNHALIQLLEVALLHPESAEGNIRQVIEALVVSGHGADLQSQLEQLRAENVSIRSRCCKAEVWYYCKQCQERCEIAE